jgi:hypothetical protein
MADRQKPLEHAPTGALERGSQIRARRQANGWTLTEFGRRRGCQLSALSLTARSHPRSWGVSHVATDGRRW